MAKLCIHTLNGNTIQAPTEAWLVALINALPTATQQDVFRRVAQMEGASLLPDKYLLGTDALGTITMVERPVIDLKGHNL
jgi:hypothetical protein